MRVDDSKSRSEFGASGGRTAIGAESWRGRGGFVAGKRRAVQFLIFGDDIEQKVEIERGAPSGIFVVFASVRAEQIIGEGA